MGEQGVDAFGVDADGERKPMTPADFLEWNWLKGEGVVFLLALCRCAPALWIPPLLGAREISRSRTDRSGVCPSRCGLYPHLLSEWQTANIDSTKDALLVSLLLKEIIIGGSMGILAGIVIWAMRSAGALIEDATLAGSGTPDGATLAIGRLLSYLAIALFFAVGGYRVYLAAVADSYRSFPLLYWPKISQLGDFALFFSHCVTDLIRLALLIAAPILAVLFLLDLAARWVGRFEPQIGSFVAALPVRAALSMVCVVLTVVLVAQMMPDLVENAILDGQKNIAKFGSGR